MPEHAHILREDGIPATSSPEKLINLVALLDDWWRLRDILSEDVPFDEVWQPDGQLVVDEGLGWNREHLCKDCQQPINAEGAWIAYGRVPQVSTASSRLVI
jgi:hypothetical protein